MPRQSTMLHVRVDERLKAEASAALAAVGLSVSDAVRIMLTRVVSEGGLPAGLATDPAAYDTWFRTKVQEALDDPRPALPHDGVMAETDDLIARKRRAAG